MTRWKITIEYDGTPYVGWQCQASGLSVQGVLESALEKFAGQNLRITAAGRTDAGVHAWGQVGHFDLDKVRSADDVRDGLNYYLRPHPIVVLAAEEVAPDFHARLSAIERRYRYRILNRRPPVGIEANRVWHVPYALDSDAMHEAAQVLVGTHDFTSFRASECQAKSPIKTLDAFTVSRLGQEVELTVRARSFLHHQVRNMVGTLALVGRGKWSAADVRTALEAKSRAAGGPTAPPDGLYFLDVRYA